MMRKRIKIIIAVVVLIILVIAGETFKLRQGEKVKVFDPWAGEEEEIVVPKIPGMKIISAELFKEGSLYTVTYLRKGQNIVKLIKEPIKISFLIQGYWLKREEKTWMRMFPTNLFLNTLREIKELIPELDFFYVFLDEFSEINGILQELIMDGLISPLYRDSENQYIVSNLFSISLSYQVRYIFRKELCCF